MIIFLDIQLALLDPLYFTYFTFLDPLFLRSNTKPITKWNITPKINIGWAINWTTKLVPIKCENWLKISSLNTDVILIMKCWSKNTIKKRPDKAMANFLIIEDWITLLTQKFYNLYTKLTLERLQDNKKSIFIWF